MARRALKRKAFPLTWKSHLQLLAEDVALAHDAELEDSGGLIKEMAATRRELQQSSVKLSLTVALGILFLLLYVNDLFVPIAIVGIHLTDAPVVPELVLFAVVALSVVLAGRAINSATLQLATAVLVQKAHPLPLNQLWKVVRLPDQVMSYYLPGLTRKTWTGAAIVANSIAVVLLFALLAVLLVASVAWRLMVYPYFFAEPSMDIELIRWLVWGTLALDVGWVLFLGVYLVPLPMRDYLALAYLEIGAQLGPREHRMAQIDIYGPGLADIANLRAEGLWEVGVPVAPLLPVSYPHYPHPTSPGSAPVRPGRSAS